MVVCDSKRKFSPHIWTWKLRDPATASQFQFAYKIKRWLLRLKLPPLLVPMLILQIALGQLGQRWRTLCWMLPLKSVVCQRTTSGNPKSDCGMNRWVKLYMRKVCLVQSLTHWGRVTHICVSNLAIIGSDDARRQAIIWNNAGILLIGTKFSEILIRIQTFAFTEMHLKVSSAKWRPFCLGLNVLNWRQMWDKACRPSGKVWGIRHNILIWWWCFPYCQTDGLHKPGLCWWGLCTQWCW